jgi:thioredoxin-like negative regulator of GroEL
MNRYLVVTLVAVVAIFISRAQKFTTLSADAITEERLERILQGTDKKVLLYFWQPNCKPCEETTPMIEEVVADYAKKFFLVKIDTSNPDNKAVHDMYSVNSIPTLVVVQKGKVQTQWVGPFRDKKLLITFLRPSGSY